MTGILAIFFPLALLAFMLFMERVERPLRNSGPSESEVQDFLDNARPDEIDTLARFGLRRAMDKLRRRRRSRLTRT